MDETLTPEARYAALAAQFVARGTASLSEKKGFGSTALLTDGRIFAMLTRGRLVVKLPRPRVAELVEAGWGVPFDANKGRPMKEWLTVDPAREADWTALAEEAQRFVAANRPEK